MLDTTESTAELPLNGASTGKRERIQQELRANPQRSDREISRVVGCDHKTVGAARERMGITTPLGNSPQPPTPTERRQMLVAAAGDFMSKYPQHIDGTSEEAVDEAIAKGIVSLAPEDEDETEDPEMCWVIPHQARIETFRSEEDPEIVEIWQEGQHGEDGDRIHVSRRNVVALARRMLWAAGFKSAELYTYVKGEGCVDLEDGDLPEHHR